MFSKGSNKVPNGVRYNYCKFQEILRWDVFHPGMRYLYGKYYFGYRDPALNKQDSA